MGVAGFSQSRLSLNLLAGPFWLPSSFGVIIIYAIAEVTLIQLLIVFFLRQKSYMTI
jgi:hypothetical protein